MLRVSISFRSVLEAYVTHTSGRTALSWRGRDPVSLQPKPEPVLIALLRYDPVPRTYEFMFAVLEGNQFNRLAHSFQKYKPFPFSARESGFTARMRRGVWILSTLKPGERFNHDSSPLPQEWPPFSSSKPATGSLSAHPNSLSDMPTTRPVYTALHCD